MTTLVEMKVEGEFGGKVDIDLCISPETTPEKLAEILGVILGHQCFRIGDRDGITPEEKGRIASTTLANAMEKGLLALINLGVERDLGEFILNFLPTDGSVN